jgi:hypothetical protein
MKTFQSRMLPAQLLDYWNSFRFVIRGVRDMFTPVHRQRRKRISPFKMESLEDRRLLSAAVAKDLPTGIPISPIVIIDPPIFFRFADAHCPMTRSRQ